MLLLLLFNETGSRTATMKVRGCPNDLVAKGPLARGRLLWGKRPVEWV